MGKREKEGICIVFYEEGYAENCFYKHVVKWCIGNGKAKFHIKHKNLKGEGNSRIVPNHFDKEVKSVYQSAIVFLCYDTDMEGRVIKRKPGIDWKEIKSILKKLDVKLVFEIKQEKCLEDILISDWYGVLRHLGLSNDIKPKSTSGEEELKRLYGLAKRVYIHSNQILMEKLISDLNIGLILQKNLKIFSELLKLYEIEISC